MANYRLTGRDVQLTINGLSTRHIESTNITMVGVAGSNPVFRFLS